MEKNFPRKGDVLKTIFCDSVAIPRLVLYYDIMVVLEKFFFCSVRILCAKDD